jgi:hypothetical protein
MKPFKLFALALAAPGPLAATEPATVTVAQG